MKAEEKVFRTIVDVPEWTEPMQKEQRFVLLGSCFAQHIGGLFQGYGLNALCNPLGVTYNPASVAIQVQKALQAASSGPAEACSLPPSLLPSIFHFDGSWRSWWAGTLLRDEDEGMLREALGGTFRRLGESLREADFLFVTLGTNVCYRLKENGMVVANCHKVPGGRFEEETMDVEACTETLRSMMELLSKECPRLRVVFTVSPYRYKKYGFHGSQLAKAALLLAVDRLCRLFPKKASYFPAYEIMLDELRDYRFYADDMIHPAPAAVHYIWCRMAESCMDAEMQHYLEEYEPTRRAQMHQARDNK